MTHSVDLRQRVVAFVNQGGEKTEAARLFKVSRWCVYNWLKRERLEPEKQGPSKPYKLCPELLKEHVKQKPDAYQRERAQAFGVSRHVVLYGLKRLGIKKNASVQRKEPRQT
jgi:transposase